MGNTLSCLRPLSKTGCCQMSDGYEAEESWKEDISHGSGSSTSHDAISSRKTCAESNTATERSLVTSERPSRESEKLDEDTPQPSPSAKKPPKLEFPLTPNPRGENKESSLQSIGTDTTELSLCTGDQSVELGDVGFSPPLARRRSSCPPPSPNLVRTHLIENYQALRDSAPCLSRAATLPKATKLEFGRGAHLKTPSSANHTAAASQPTGRIAKAASWLHLSRIYRASSQGSSNNPGNRSRRWTDEVLEGFLDSTMVQGTGLVLTKLSSGSRKTKGERIMTYNPSTSELLWKSSGFVSKEGGMKAKAIDGVKREGTIVRILYSASEAEGGPRRQGRKSLLRRTKASEQKVFQATTERDAQILQEILLLLRQKERDAEDAVDRAKNERGSFGASPPQCRRGRTQPSV